MAWNKALPAGSTAVSASDGVIRDNWAYIRDAINQEHGDPDANPSDATQIVHSQGSGRVIVYVGATVLDSSADVVAQVTELYHDARDIGRTVVDRNVTATPGAVWYCTAIDTFLELTRLWGNAVIGGTLDVTGASTMTGAVTANGGIVVPTTKQIQVPPAESSIYDGTNSLDVFSHAARHLLLGGDPLTGLVAGNVIYKTATGPTASAGTLVTHTFDFSGRAGDTLILALAWVVTDWFLQAGGNCIETLAVQLNDVDKSQIVTLEADIASGQLNNYQASGFVPTAFVVPNSSAQKIDLELKTVSGSAGRKDLINYGMILVDLGAVALTT